MARRVVTWMQSWLAFWIFGAWLALWFLTHFWPPSWWLEVRRVVVFDTVPGAEVIMDVDREIRRNFIADWAVVVRRYVGGAWTVECTARGTSDYRPTAALPDPLTLDWWTEGECPNLRSGRYLVSTIWTVRGQYGLPDKVIQSLSNVFEVRNP